jgi:serpin B
MRWIIAIFVLAAFIMGFTSADALAQARIAQTREMADKDLLILGNNIFAFDLYRELSKTDGNLFFSPTSISVAMAITYAGANNDTEAQMAEVLNYKLSQGRIHVAFSDVLKDLNIGSKRSPYRLVTANRLWSQYGYEFQDNFINIADEYYDGGFKKVDFTVDRKAASKKINKWIEEKTEEKIKNLIPISALSPLTRLIITNAIYFKGMWMFQFKEEETKPRSFTLTNGETIKVPMMTQTEDFSYFENNNLKILEMLYAGGELSMVILLPKKRDGLKKLEASLTSKNIRIWLGSMRKVEAILYMPKFKMDSSFFLKNALSSMGMPDAFSPDKADFSGIASGRDLYINDVIHKAFVDVNEEGTEAAAATGVVMGITSVEAGKKMVYFNVDHPFAFFIRDRRTKNILFLGRVTDPRK